MLVVEPSIHFKNRRTLHFFIIDLMNDGAWAFKKIANESY